MARHDTKVTIPSKEDAALAREVSRALSASEGGTAALQLLVRRAMLTLPEAARKPLRILLEELGKGRPVIVIPLDAEVTSQQAADILDVSRPHVVSLIEKGLLPARKVGTQRRLRLEDVLAYKAATRTERIEALGELTDLDQDLGLR